MVNFNERIHSMKWGLERENIVLGQIEPLLLELQKLRETKIDVSVDGEWRENIVKDLEKEKQLLDQLIVLFEKLQNLRKEKK